MGLRRKNRKDYKASKDVVEKTKPVINPKITVGAKILSFIVPKMFRDKNGKWSSKRTIGGVIAVAAVHQIEVSSDVTWQHLVMLALAVATVYAPDSK
tara:strand:- start:4820 stop:5110 length:291 start_codon:yes stop_codon:yes gene_type:complete